MKTLAKILLILTVIFVLCVVTAGAALTWAVYDSGMISVRVTEKDWDDTTHRVRVMFPAAFANVAIRTLPVIKRLDEWDHDHHWDDDWDGYDDHGLDIDASFNHHHWSAGNGDIEKWLPFLEAVADELGRYPDIDLVQVDDGDEHVRVAIRRGALYIDVHTPDEEVEVRIPSKTVKLALRTLAELD